MKKEKLLLILILLVILCVIFLPITSAQPTINFTLPTPSNGTTVNSDSIYVNLTGQGGEHYSFVDFDNDNVLWMRMDYINQSNGVGALVYDNSSYANNATAKGDANQTPDGKFGKAYVFDGTTDFITILDHTSLDLNTSFTISIWIKPGADMGAGSGDRMIIGKESATPCTYAWSVYMDDGKIRLKAGSIPCGASSAISNDLLALDAWTHVVVMYKKSTSQQIFYINGTYDKSSTSNVYSINKNSQNVTIGMRTGGGMAFNGTIDDIIIINRTLDANEISSLYNSTASQYYHNFTDLDDGQHHFIGYVINGSELNESERYVASDGNSPNAVIGQNTSQVEYSSEGININWTATDDNGINYTILNITYPNNTILYNSTSSSGEINLTSTANLSVLGIYNITLWANDSSGNSGITSTIFSVNDTIYPNITLISPANDISSTTDAYNFTFNVSDNNTISNCSLILDGNIINTLTSVSKAPSTMGMYNSSLSVASHTWSINCTDVANNEENSSERTLTVSSSTSSTPSTPGGSGGTFVKECETDEDCNESYSCYNKQCVKLFDVKIIKVDSPIEQEQFFNFTYLVKAMAEINSDVIIDFWLEKNKEKITSGFDTIYFGSFEERTENSQLFLPGNIDDGIYDFYVQASYENYKAKALRTIQVGESFEELQEIKPFPKSIYYLIILILLILITIILILYIKARKESHHSLIRGVGIIGFSLIGILFFGQNNITGNVTGSNLIKNWFSFLYFFFIIGILGLFVFLHRKNTKKINIIKMKNEYGYSNLKDLINKKVYCDGDYIGKVKDVILNDCKIETLKIRPSKKSKRKGIILKYKHVDNVGDIVIINNKLYKI